jgi:hypothetical protein
VSDPGELRVSDLLLAGGDGVALAGAAEVAWGAAIVDGRVVGDLIEGREFLVMERAR